ncbi:MAG: sugar ABC transporter ATP-binding protein [Candidatus Methylomirabilales bacterium]
MAEPLLQIVRVSKSFPGVAALAEVDFDLRAGEVHVLIGENGAGKSTLIKLLSGAYAADEGRFVLDGREVAIGSVRRAQELGIATIYQEMNLIPELTVAQNILLGREPRRAGGLLVDAEACRRRSAELLGSLGQHLDPDAPVKSLSVPQQQMVEVAKALSMAARIVIFDEPTDTLADQETEALFRMIRRLKSQGVGIIYISHRLEEIRQIGDRVTVLRDGRRIETLPVAEARLDALIRMMVGREITDQFPRRRQPRGEVALEVRGLSLAGVVQDVSLSVHRGEIVGLAGLVGSGRTAVARLLFGVDRPDAGEVRLFGRPAALGSPQAASRQGLAFCTEDRKALGLFQILPVSDNIILAAIRRLFPRGWVGAAGEREVAGEYVRRLRIQTPGLAQAVQYLSGGNQQKVVLAKWLATKARLFILDEPTRGIDVGAKLEIHRLMDELVAQGTPILMISSEMPEILGMSDRIYVMHQGRIAGEFTHAEASQERILKCAVGGSA